MYGELSLPEETQVSMRSMALWVVASPGRFLLLLQAPGAPGEAQLEQPAGMARL